MSDKRMGPKRSGLADSRDVRSYWEKHLHDTSMTKHPEGSREFFDDLYEYHFDKLHYLPRVVDFEGCRDKRVLELGCGLGTDLLRFARGGARLTAVDFSRKALGLARANLRLHGINHNAGFVLGDAELLPFPDNHFDAVYAHGLIQYTADPAKLIAECRRVLKPGARAVIMAYNRVSWLWALSKLMKVELEHADAPVQRVYSIPELRELLGGFSDVRIVPERFPVRSILHKGWKAVLYNNIFVGMFNVLPRALVRRFGWHLIAFCTK